MVRQVSIKQNIWFFKTILASQPLRKLGVFYAPRSVLHIPQNLLLRSASSPSFLGEIGNFSF